MNALLHEFAPFAIRQFWQLTFVALIVAVVVRFCCQRRPHLAYLLWMLVIIKCLTPPLWSSPTGLFSWVSAQRAASSGSAIELTEDDLDMGLPASAMFAERNPLPTEEPVGATAMISGVSVVTVVGLIWLVGCLVFAGIVIAKRTACHIVLRRCSKPAEPELAVLARELSLRLGVWNNVRVLVASRPIGPAAWGAIRPTILWHCASARRRSIPDSACSRRDLGRP